MKKRNVIIGTILAGSVAALAAVGTVSAEPHGGCGHGFAGPQAAVFGGHMMRGHGPWRHMMKRLDLTEKQRDKIFDIRYAQRPAVRDKMKQLRKDREALRAAAMTENYDPQQVRELANAQAKTIGDLIVMRTGTFNRIYRLLTPEQQAQVAKWKQDRHGRRFRGH